MEEKACFTPFRDFLSKYFIGKVQKISIDAGFTCPNRDGTLGRGGCTYCNNQTFNPDYCKPKKSVTQQLEEGKAFFAKKYPTMQFLAYFQAYTNTYDKVEKLQRLYEEALAVSGVVGIVIGTRPDCVSDELLAYLEALSKKTFVLVEYGIESTDNRLLQEINRGHTFEQTKEAILKTAERNILVGGHLIIGLPGDTKEHLLNQITLLSNLPLVTLKFHQLQIIRGTVMGKTYLQNPSAFSLYTPEEYVALMAEMLCYLRPSLVVERFTSQSPDELLIAPKWGLKNFEFTHRLTQYMYKHQLYQGKFWKED